jgi:hypothetical protein
MDADRLGCGFNPQRDSRYRVIPILHVRKLDDGHGDGDVECHGLRKRKMREIGFGAGSAAPRPPSMQVESADVYEVLAGRGDEPRLLRLDVALSGRVRAWRQPELLHEPEVVEPPPTFDDLGVCDAEDVDAA